MVINDFAIILHHIQICVDAIWQERLVIFIISYETYHTCYHKHYRITEYIISKNIIIFYMYFLAKNLKILKTHQVTFKGCFRIYKQYKYTSFIYLWYNGDLVPQFMEANLLCIYIVYYYGAVDFGHSKHQADQGAFASPCTSHQSNLQHFSE